MKKILNETKDGVCQTITAHYYKEGVSNIIVGVGGYIPYIFLEIDESDTTARKNGLREEDTQLV